MEELKRTPLYDVHVAGGGKIVPFGGYELPVQYETGIIKEHMAVREKCGLFDVSHMGEIVISGPDALRTLNHLMTNDFTSMTDGRCRYSPMCREDGGILDDLLVYRLQEDRYMIIVNASNRDKDSVWMQNHLLGDVTFDDQSDDWALLALQGPQAKTILTKLAKEEDLPETFYNFKEDVDVDGINCLVSRTGYTGEFGYELYCATEDAEALWKKLLQAGAKHGLIPCGLGARDTLRLEAGMPLYGHEMTEEIDPFEAELGMFVKMDKADFIGKEALSAKTEPQTHRIGLKITGRGIAREGTPVQKDDEPIGVVTSGTHCPYLGGAYAMAMVNSHYGTIGETVDVLLRNKPVSAEIVALPFYKRS